MGGKHRTRSDPDTDPDAEWGKPWAGEGDGAFHVGRVAFDAGRSLFAQGGSRSPSAIIGTQASPPRRRKGSRGHHEPGTPTPPIPPTSRSTHIPTDPLLARGPRARRSPIRAFRPFCVLCDPCVSPIRTLRPPRSSAQGSAPGIPQPESAWPSTTSSISKRPDKLDSKSPASPVQGL